jgi:hypothetical protein
MKRRWYLWLLIVMLVACKGKIVVEAGLRDIQFSYEEQKNGLGQVWVRHDDVASYCTADEVLQEKARWLNDHYFGLTRVSYRTITTNDPEYDGFWDPNDGCGKIGSADSSHTEPFLMTDICALQPSRENLSGDILIPEEYVCAVSMTVDNPAIKYAD